MKQLLIILSVLILVIGLILICRPSYLPDNDTLINFQIAMTEGI